MNVILFGPPGAGKGTQAQFIVKKHNYFQLSTGNLLRNEVKSKTELGTDIEKLISNGKFVSDEIVNTLLRQSLINLKYRDRIIFDGYPRNVDQAVNLKVILNEFNQTIGHTIFLNVSRDTIEKRIMGSSAAHAHGLSRCAPAPRPRRPECCHLGLRKSPLDRNLE